MTGKTNHATAVHSTTGKGSEALVKTYGTECNSSQSLARKSGEYRNKFMRVLVSAILARLSGDSASDYFNL